MIKTQFIVFRYTMMSMHDREQYHGIIHHVIVAWRSVEQQCSIQGGLTSMDGASIIHCSNIAVSRCHRASIPYIYCSHHLINSHLNKLTIRNQLPVLLPNI